MGKHKNGFSEGLDRDSSKNKYDSNHYYDCRNLRILTQDELTSGALENMKGSYRRILFDNGPYYIIGSYTLGENLIIWTSESNATGTPSSATLCHIFAIPITDIKALKDTSNTIDIDIADGYFHNSGNLLYSGYLELGVDYPIKAVGRVESDTIKKIYWVDGYNRLRHLNIVHNASINNLETLTEDQLEVIGDIDLSAPSVVELLTGNLKAGKVQYCYQLYKLGGAETVFSSLSNLIPLTGSSDASSSSESYKGSDIDDNTGKSVRGKIVIDQSGYQRVRIVGIQYTDYNLEPEIRIIEERVITGTAGEVIYFIDSGTTIGNLILEDLRTIGTVLFIPNEIETKDNILFTGNVTEESFDVDFDARAYRFGGNSSVSTEPNYNDTATYRRKAFFSNEDGGTYYINSDKELWYATTRLGSYSQIGDWEDVPEDADCINEFNNLDNDGDHDYRMMYKSDGATLGGEGPNVSYEFSVKTTKFDNFAIGSQEKIYTSLEATVDNPSYTNYASPYNVQKYTGYARDEIYRFGIVFFDEKGRSSFVKWIGDIRMPSMSTISDTYNYSKYTGTGAQLQINDINISDVLPVESLYRISFGEETYTSVQPVDYAAAITELYNKINADSELATASNLSASGGDFSFTLTFDLIPDTYSINTKDVAVSETQPYAPAGTPFYDFAISYYSGATGGDGLLYMNILHLYFFISNVPTEAVNYQIVRTARTSSDRTLVSQGLTMGTITNSGETFHVEFDSSSAWTNTYSFQSPETAIFKNIVHQSNDKLQNVATLRDVSGDYVAGPAIKKAATGTQLDIYKYGEVVALDDPQEPASTATLTDEFYSLEQTTIEEGQIVRQDEVSVNLGTVNYITYNLYQHSDKGIAFIFNATETSWTPKNKGITARYLTNYRRNLFFTQYNGNTYIDRSKNIYIPASRIQDADVEGLNVFGGDTYINLFDYLYSSWEDGYDGSSTPAVPAVVYFPCESTINCDIRNDDSTRHVYGTDNARYIHDTANIWVDGTGGEFSQSDLYVYNTVYSKENDTKLFLSKPFDWTSQTKFSTRVYASQSKINNELSDSWIRFGTNSYIDVDPQYGKLSALITVSEKLLFFQPKAFGVLSVNERALLQTSDVSELSLGKSGVLDRFDYSKTDTGATSRQHITLTPNGLYWVDYINKAMFKFGSGIEEMSMIKGLDGWFRNNINYETMLMYHNPEYREVYLTDYSGAWTLMYSESTDSFLGFTSFYPVLAVNYENRLMTSPTRTNLDLHDDSYAERCDFATGSNADSSITLIVNPSSTDVSMYNNIEWLMEAFDNAGVDIKETFTDIQIWNDYQHSGVINLTVDGNVKRRMRKWRYTIPRAKYKRNGSTPLDRGDARFRDSHLFIKFTLTNASDKKFVVHDIITSYIMSNK